MEVDLRFGLKPLLVAALLGAVLPVVSAAGSFDGAMPYAPPPECDVCKTHGFFGATVHHFGTGDTEYDCDAFNSCHPGDQIGSCGEYHFGCDEAMNFDRATDFDRIERAVQTQGLVGLAELLERSPAVRVLSGIGAVQVVDCNGSVIAHFPMVPGRSIVATED